MEQFNAVATGTTTVPNDDTIPQITEGDEYMTISYTPKSATNILVIEAEAQATNSASNNMAMALFVDTTADALASGVVLTAGTGTNQRQSIRYKTVAGSTTARTYRVRIGGNAAGTTTFNGQASARRHGDIPKSSIIIWEYKA